MNQNTIDSLFELCDRLDADLGRIESFIVDNHASPEEITVAAIRLAHTHTHEISLSNYPDTPLPSPAERITTGWVELFELFLKYGLLPNLIIQEDHDELNIMNEIRHIQNEDVAPTIMRMLMEHGGDPNLFIDGGSIFEDLDYFVVFDVVELDNKLIFDVEFKVWLVLMGYGGYIKDHECPVQMKNGYSIEIFKNFEEFDYRIEFIPKDWFMHIYRKDNGEEVAIL